MKKTFFAAAVILCASIACQRTLFQRDFCTDGIGNRGDLILPTSRIITPAGTLIKVGGHPQGMALNPTGTLLLVSENGIFLPHGIRSIDPKTGEVLGFIRQTNLFFGVAISPDGTAAYASGGGDNVLYKYSIAGRTVSVSQSLPLPGFSAGVAVSPSGTVFAAIVTGNSVVAVDPTSWSITRVFGAADGVQAFPWSLVVSPDGSMLIVLNRGSGTASLIPLSGTVPAVVVPLGDPPAQIHPSAVACAAGGGVCYIANANADTISVLDLRKKSVSAVWSVSPYPGAPLGSSPVALALSPDGKALYAALAGENAVAVLDAASGLITGKIPTSWYPSALALSPDGRRLYVASMKGEAQDARWPITPDTSNTIWAVRGTMSLIDVPGPGALAGGIGQVKSNNCFQALSDKKQTSEAFTKVKHVVYIFKENKTFDSVFGDVKPYGAEYPAGYAGFSAPRAITPNQHALADRYTLVPNFYSDYEVSVQGHIYAVSANEPDWVERLVPLDYGGHPVPIPGYNNRVEAYPINRFIFDRLVQAGLTFSNFGEFLSVDNAALQPFNVAVDSFTDVARAREFQRALEYFESRGSMPPLVFIALPQDHCPPCYYAMNDLATGMIVDGLSHSSFWKDSVVFITEDDPQPGWDHVNDHRMFAVVAGPYVKRKFVSQKRYSFTSVLKTIELILGVPPLSEFDASALGMKDLFTTESDPTPYAVLPVPYNPSQWPASVREFKDMEKMWCDKYGGMFTDPHPLCTAHKFPTWRFEDD